MIVTLEIIFNLAEFFYDLPSWRFYGNDSNLRFLIILKKYSSLFNYVALISYNCHFPILCLLLKVLWLAYLHSPYKCTIIRWMAYTAIRCVVIAGLYKLSHSECIPSYRSELLILVDAVLAIAYLSDFLTYLSYSRRLYKQLKSREIEARLFKDRASYYTERSLCASK